MFSSSPPINALNRVMINTLSDVFSTFNDEFMMTGGWLSKKSSPVISDIFLSIIFTFKVLFLKLVFSKLHLNTKL